jgi:hypothetical protein
MSKDRRLNGPSSAPDAEDTEREMEEWVPLRVREARLARKRRDDRQGIAMLAGLEIHCDKCDAATHMGLAVRRGKRDMAIAQLCEINGIRPEEAEQLFGDAMILWRKRNEKQWRIVVAKQLLARYPQVAALESAWSRRRGEIPR